MFYPLDTNEFTLSEDERLYSKRCAIRYKPNAIRDESTNYYVRNYKKNMQNKANFQKSQVNLTNAITREYEQMGTWSSEKNKDNSKPSMFMLIAASAAMTIKAVLWFISSSWAGESCHGVYGVGLGVVRWLRR